MQDLLAHDPSTRTATAPRALTASLDAALAPVDRVRRAWLAWFAPRARTLVLDREARVAVTGSMALLVSLLGAVVAPVWLLVLGPLAWGVSHVLAEVRYLVARPGLHRRPWLWLALGGPVLLAALSPLGVRAGLAGALGAVLCARGIGALRRGALLALCGALLAAAWAYPRAADVFFAHAHNLVAVGLFWAWRPRARRWHLAPLALFAAASAWILLGGAEPLASAFDGWHPARAGAPLGALLNTVAPFPGHLEFARCLLRWFAFAQSAHYAVWLRLVPDEARPRPTPRSFRQSARALLADVGPWVLGAAAVLAAFFPLAALVAGAAWSRDAYLRFALFHGHLELGAVALLWAERRRP